MNDINDCLKDIKSELEKIYKIDEIEERKQFSHINRIGKIFDETKDNSLIIKFCNGFNYAFTYETMMGYFYSKISLNDMIKELCRGIDNCYLTNIRK